MILDIYTRVSRKGDERQLSTRGQAKYCRVVVQERGAEVGEVLEDNGKSAWNPRTIRPDWNRLMDRLEAGLSDGVVIYDLSRFTRNHRDALRLTEAADKGAIILDSEQEWNLDNPEAFKAFWDLVTANAYFSKLTSKKVKRGKYMRALDGLPSGGPRGFGFEPDGMTIREDEAEILREWTTRTLAGETQGVLTDEAAARGIVTPVGVPFCRQTLRKVLLRPINAGIIEHNGEEVATMEGEPIIPVEQFRELQRMFRKRRRGRPVKYLCSGRYVSRCGVCGHYLTGRPRDHHRPYADGETRREYWCSPADGGCGHIFIDMRDLDGWAAEWAVRELASPDHATAVARRQAEFSAQRAALEAEVAAVEADMDEEKETYLADKPAARRAGREDRLRRRHERAMKRLRDQLSALDAELAGLVAESTAPKPSRTIPDRDAAYLYHLDRWTSGTPGEQRQILMEALGDERRIVVSPGRDVTERVKIRRAKLCPGR